MIRGRVVAVNGIEAQTWERGHRPMDAPGPGLRSERNLTWATELADDNSIVEGTWWAPDEPRALVSLEDDYAASLGLEVGDRLSFDIAGQLVDVEVASLRRLDWESMRPNFFIIFSPAVLADFPATFMTSFYLPAEEKRFLNRLLSRFPTITVIEVDAIIAQVQRIIGRVTEVVELVLMLVVGSGCLVLIASIQASRDTRMAEHALVRTLGGTRNLIRGSLLAEFGVLGFFAGVVAVWVRKSPWQYYRFRCSSCLSACIPGCGQWGRFSARCSYCWWACSVLAASSPRPPGLSCERRKFDANLRLRCRRH